MSMERPHKKWKPNMCMLVCTLPCPLFVAIKSRFCKFMSHIDGRYLNVISKMRPAAGLNLTD